MTPQVVAGAVARTMPSATSAVDTALMTWCHTCVDHVAQTMRPGMCVAVTVLMMRLGTSVAAAAQMTS